MYHAQHSAYSYALPATYITTYGTFYTKMGLFYNIQFKSIPIFNTTYHTITIRESPFWCLTHAGYRRFKVRYPVGFKTATSSGRSVQIGSK